MGKKIKIALGGKVDNPLDQLSLRSLTVNVELADATKIAALVFGLNQIVDRGVGRPILYVVARAIGADERHHPKSGSLGIDELMGTLVRAAIRQDPGDIVAAKNIEHALERIEGIGLLIIVQMRVEDFQRWLRNTRRGYAHQNERSNEHAHDATRHGEPLDMFS